MKSIILLSGPVGAGKTEVARELVNELDGPVANIEGDKFWFFIAKGGRELGQKKNFRTIMAAMTAAAIPYVMAGYHVILDFSIPPWFLEAACKIVKKREIPLDFVVLRPSEKVCAERAASRAQGQISDYTPYRELHAAFDEAERYIIHDDTSDAATVAKLIRKGLDEGKFRLD
ncbi:MAG TPA: AAA family ATPase [Candidatus Sulfotelmatobacter sp.]|jgi:predicted kinase